MAALHEADRRLARRMLAGEEAAFNEFFDRHFPGLYRYCLPRLGYDGADAEDVAQTTICTAISKLSTYRGEAALFTWLCAICRHEIGEALRRRVRRAAVVLDESPEINAALESLSDRDPDHPQTSLERDELVRAVHAMLIQLPAHYAEILTLKYLEGLSVNEIAERLQTNPKAAESLLTRARQAFRDGFSASRGALPRTAGSSRRGEP